MWSLASPRGVFFTASPSRGADVARGLVRDFDGTLMVELERHRHAMARFGQGLKPLDAIARVLA